MIHNTQNIDAITLAKRYKSKAAMVTKLCNDWSLRIIDIHELEVTEYFLLYWQGKHLKNTISEGTIERDGNIYSIVYKTSPAILFKSQQVILSFRASSVGNFVLIKSQDKEILS